MKTVELVKSNQIETIDLRNQSCACYEEKPELSIITLGDEYLSNGGCIVTFVKTLQNNLVACHNDNRIFIIDVSEANSGFNKVNLVSCIASDSGIEVMQELQDGQLLCSDRNNVLKIYNPTTAHCIKTYCVQNKHIECMIGLPNNGIATADGGYVNIWHAKTGQLLQTLLSQNMSDISAMCLQDNQYLITGCLDGMIFKWDLFTSKCIGQFNAKEPVRSLLIDLCGNLMAGIHDGSIYKIELGKKVNRYSTMKPFFKGLFERFCLLPDGCIIAGYTLNGIILDSIAHNIVQLFTDTNYEFNSVTSLSDGRLVIGNYKGWNLAVLKFPPRDISGEDIEILLMNIISSKSVKNINLPDTYVINQGYDDSYMRAFIEKRPDIEILVRGTAVTTV